MGTRQETRGRIERQIVELGREQLATVGAAGLSVRAVARDLGMVSSAVYRYVASRDDLLTLLLVDAYDELADTVDAARELAGPQWAEQVRGIALAARGWAVRNPSRWALLYGSPVPGYHAPAESTVGPGTRVVGTLFAVIGTGVQEGGVPSSDDLLPQPTSSDFAGLRAEFGFRAGDLVVARCLTLWATLVGAISLEVFGQYGADTLTDPGAVFALQIEQVIDLLRRQD